MSINTRIIHKHDTAANNKTLAAHTGSTDTTGGNQAHNNMPPYYALCFIMKI